MNDTELALARQAGDFVSITESRLDGQETVVAFRPRAAWPRAFGFFRLYR